MDHLSAATVAPTGSLNIMVIEPPIFVKGPLSNLTSFRLRRPFRSRLAKDSGDGYFSRVSRAFPFTHKIRNSFRRLMHISLSITMFEATFKPRTIEKAATQRNLHLAQALSFF